MRPHLRPATCTPLPAARTSSGGLSGFRYLYPYQRSPRPDGASQRNGRISAGSGWSWAAMISCRGSAPASALGANQAPDMSSGGRVGAARGLIASHGCVGLEFSANAGAPVTETIYGRAVRRRPGTVPACRLRNCDSLRAHPPSGQSRHRVPERHGRSQPRSTCRHRTLLLGRFVPGVGAPADQRPWAIPPRQLGTVA